MHSTVALGRHRFAIAAVFFVNGAMLASWLAHIPAVKARHDLGDDQLGLLLLTMAAGSVLSLPIAGWLVPRFGSRLVTTCAAFSFCAVLPLPVLAPNAALVALALGCLGACN